MAKITIQEQDRREKQREWRKEQTIELKNEYGVTDTTPHLASKNIINKSRES